MSDDIFSFDDEGNNVQQLVEALTRIIDEEHINTKAAYSQQAAMDITYIRMVKARMEGKKIPEVAETMVNEYQKASRSINGKSMVQYLEAVKMLQDMFKQISVLQEAGREGVKWKPWQK